MVVEDEDVVVAEPLDTAAADAAAVAAAAVRAVDLWRVDPEEELEAPKAKKRKNN